ncbi:hypothetical protein AMELA_G00027640 [Ameiurus melas]|uniref:Uncharacterized protein n=1 Tax=Ameiurus melas TaxID=219545 RepID=A0A7J6BDT8_AMEME|nr:hypothetical protein AMELA_G00027640 [Ameiurus melas]
MSKIMKSRNVEKADSGSCDERILTDCHQMYTDTDCGNKPSAHSIPLLFSLMRYVEEHIQKTGVAIGTPGFTFVTSGRKRESLRGNATFQMYPHFKTLQEVKGVSEYVGAEICTSRQKRFSLVTFVDTPGLVDGDMEYPFDVDQAILWLAQSTCESDRGGVSHQEKIINQTVQNTLNTLEKDCEIICTAVTDTLNDDRQCSVENRRARCKSCFLGLLGFSVPLLLLFTLVLGSLSREMLELALGSEGTDTLSLYLTPVLKTFESLSGETQLYFCGGLVLLSFILLILARFSSRLVHLCALMLSQQISRFECYLKSPSSPIFKSSFEEPVLLLVPDKS